jgi:hypothetical protein
MASGSMTLNKEEAALSLAGDGEKRRKRREAQAREA